MSDLLVHEFQTIGPAIEKAQPTAVYVESTTRYNNIVFLLHALKDLRDLLFYMLCAVFQRMFLNIFVVILFTFSAICVFFFIFKF